MKPKLFKFFFVGIFLMSGMPIFAQTYICLQKDVDAVAVSSDSYLKLYKNSTIQVDEQLKVRVESITDQGKTASDNIAGGFAVGAVFDVIKNDNDLKKVHYQDNVKERYDAPGVTISVNFITKVDGKEYLVPFTDAEIVELQTGMTDLYAHVFKYNEANSSLVYVPIATHSLPEGAKLVIDEAKQISNIEENEPVEVHKGANIRLILSSEGSYFLDQLFNTSDLEKIAITNPDDPEDEKILYYIIGGVIALLLILCLGYFYLKSFKNKDNSTTVESKDDFDCYSRSDLKPSNKDKKKQGNENKVAGLSSDITPELEHVIQKLEIIQGSLNQMAPVLNQIKVTISDRKEVERLNGEIEQKNSAILQRDKIIEAKDTFIEQKEKEIGQYINQINTLTNNMDKLRHQLEEANKLDKDTLIIADGKLLAQKANGLLTVCRKGEEIVKQYISLLPESDNLKMSYFLTNYIKEMPSKSRDLWNGVMSTLSIKGFIKDLEITRYLQNESDQLGWLKKHFIEDFLQSYISPLIIMLDQIRCSKQFGITMPAPSNIEKAINEIIEECKKIGVTVKYKPLFELITTDDKEWIIDEIGSDLPKAIESFVLVKENVPLFFAHIGVVAEGVKDDKTICIAKL